MLNFKNYTLLIVDDDEDLRETLSYTFKKRGFTVLQANSGDAGYVVFQENNIDLILCDMRMPNGDGISLLDRVRAKNPEIPVLIFLTGYSDASDEECIAKGAKAVYLKPFNQKELLQSVIDSLIPQAA